jgi:ABC-type lipoprotein release transport system permease subunit
MSVLNHTANSRVIKFNAACAQAVVGLGFDIRHLLVCLLSACGFAGRDAWFARACLRGHFRDSRLVDSRSRKRQKIRRRNISRVVLIVLLFSAASTAHAQLDQNQFVADVRFLSSLPTRMPGSGGYSQAAGYLQDQIAPLANVKLKRHTFPVMVPFTESATITTARGVENIFPFWPAGIRLNSTPVEGITGQLVYCRDGDLKDIHPAQLQGQIAVIESTAGQNWTLAFQMGAAAALILGSPETNNIDLRAHDLAIPVNFPRFYIPPGPLADALRGRNGALTGPVTLKASVSWRKVQAVNYYALVKPVTPRSEGSSPPAALGITVPFESASLVPDLAPGTGQAVQTAAALALLRDLSARPPDRPVLFCFTGADSLSFQASRNMYMALSDIPATWTAEINDLTTRQTEAQKQLDRVRHIAAHPEALSTYDDYALIARLSKIVQTRAMNVQDRLFNVRNLKPDQQTAEEKAERQNLENRQAMLSHLDYAFKEKPSELASPQLITEAKSVCQRCIETLGGSPEKHRDGLVQDFIQRRELLLDRVDDYRWLATAEGRNPDPAVGSTNDWLIELMVGLDLTDKAYRCGPMHFGSFAHSSTVGDIQHYSEWFTTAQKHFENNDAGYGWFRDIAGVMDLSPLSNALAPTSWMPGTQSIPSELGQAWGIPSLSFISLDDLRQYRDTPADTFDKIKSFRSLMQQLEAVRGLLWHAISDPKFTGTGDHKPSRITLSGQVVSPSPGQPVPDLPRGGFLATYYNVNNDDGRIPSLRSQGYCIGTRRTEVQPTDADGNYRFEGMWRLAPDQEDVAINAFDIQPATGAVTACTDLGTQGGDVQVYANYRDRDPDPLRSLVFNCAEFSLAGLYDPRFLQDLNDVLPLDARRNSDPQKFNMLIQHQLMSGFVEPGTKLYLLFRYGRVGNRLILINMPEEKNKNSLPNVSVDELGQGFTTGQLDHLGPLSLVTARDFWRIDDLRLAKYAKAGVTSDLIDSLHKQAGAQIAQASELAKDKDADGQAIVTNANGAWANEARVYSAAQDMANDVIHAAIFLLLLLVPFSFCMERLLIGTPNVYRQIGGIFAIFAVMTAALWSFHPAFKISSSPLIIILAFAIILMSLVVISVVYTKFEVELKRIRSGRGSMEGASIARASVMMSAVMLGIANMRRRKFRTALTSITIVLITFAVLCFTSASRYLDTSTLATGVPSKYSGLMIRQRGFRAMTQQMLMNLRGSLDELYRDQKRTDQPLIVERYWNINPYDPQDAIHIVANPQTQIALPAMLGISPGEPLLGSLGQVIDPAKLSELEKNPNATIIYLSSTIAKQLGVKENDVVDIGGIGLTVAGIFDADAFDQKVNLLSGESLAPLKYVKDALDAGGKRLGDSGADDLNLDTASGGQELSNSYEHLSASQFAIIPAAISRLLPNCRLSTIGVKLADDIDQGDPLVKTVAADLSRRFSVAIYAGEKDGVQLVVASNLSSVSGAGQVAIPLAIAGLIIFNTMMGSIAERRKEIHIYTSLGLAPLHVGALFIAEAMTYGLIGTVFGYIFGQGFGTLLLKLGWLGNVTLNYSGTSAMLTMGLILLIVLVSALVPARLASKIAAPSIERSWKVPLPRGDEIVAVLPFTINKAASEGVLAYLADFFDAHQEGSIGKFSAGGVDSFSIPDDAGHLSRGLKTTIWLTPFDLGVRQHLMLLVHPGQYPDIYEVQVVLSRLSGDTHSWYRMNRSFLTELRRQFLQWRSLSPERMLEYTQVSRQLFSEMQNAE